MALFTPTNQKRLTNVSIVRLRRNGKRFELACYPNKILHNGDIQITEAERKTENEAVFKDVAKIIAEKCVNPETNYQYSENMIEKMMRNCHINLNTGNKNAKQLALQTIKILRQNPNLKIAPALLEFNIGISLDVKSEIIDSIKDHCNSISQEKNQDNQLLINGMIEPENYHKLETFLNQKIKGKFSIEILEKSKFGSQSIPNLTKNSSKPKQTEDKADVSEEPIKVKPKGKRKRRQHLSDDDDSI